MYYKGRGGGREGNGREGEKRNVLRGGGGGGGRKRERETEGRENFEEPGDTERRERKERKNVCVRETERKVNESYQE